MMRLSPLLFPWSGHCLYKMHTFIPFLLFPKLPGIFSIPFQGKEAGIRRMRKKQNKEFTSEEESGPIFHAPTNFIFSGISKMCGIWLSPVSKVNLMKHLLE